MTDADLKAATQEIVVDEVFPHAPETIWKALTNGDLIARWMMQPTGFEAVKGNDFTFQTSPAGAWDGRIRCRVLQAIPNERLAYAWKGGSEENEGYGSLLDTVVKFRLSKAEGGTRLRLIHSGFVVPKNETAYRNMGAGWPKCFERLEAVASGRGRPQIATKPADADCEFDTWKENRWPRLTRADALAARSATRSTQNP